MPIGGNIYDKRELLEQKIEWLQEHLKLLSEKLLSDLYKKFAGYLDACTDFGCDQRLIPKLWDMLVYKRNFDIKYVIKEGDEEKYIEESKADQEKDEDGNIVIYPFFIDYYFDDFVDDVLSLWTRTKAVSYGEYQLGGNWSGGYMATYVAHGYVLSVSNWEDITEYSDLWVDDKPDKKYGLPSPDFLGDMGYDTEEWEYLRIYSRVMTTEELVKYEGEWWNAWHITFYGNDGKEHVIEKSSTPTDESEGNEG